MSEVYVNDDFAGLIMFNNILDISKFVKSGENKIKLTVFSSARNIIGPFHFEIEEPLSVLPKHFKFENDWSNDSCTYRDRYALTKFGIELDLIEG